MDVSRTVARPSRRGSTLANGEPLANRSRVSFLRGRTITTNCFATSNAIAKASLLLHGFLRDVRESRAEIDPLLGELQSLDTILDLLKDDAASFPPDLARLTPVLLDNCAILADEIGSSITSFSGHTLPVKEKRWKWLANRKELAVLGLALQGYKGVLGAAVDLVGVYVGVLPSPPLFFLSSPFPCFRWFAKNPPARLLYVPKHMTAPRDTTSMRPPRS